MKIFREYFWGVFLIFSGVVLLLKLRTNMNISAIRLIIGFFFVYFGLSVMFGGFYPKSEKDLIFDSGNIKPIELSKEYNVIFSSGVIDLSDINLDSPKKVEINCVFGSGTVYINEDMNVVINGNAAFASLSTPDGRNLHFGDTKFGNNLEKSTNYLVIEANSVFGNLDIRFKK